MNRMKKDYTNFNRNLRMFREKRGITANELADRVGQPHIYAIYSPTF